MPSSSILAAVNAMSACCMPVTTSFQFTLSWRSRGVMVLTISQCLSWSITLLSKAQPSRCWERTTKSVSSERSRTRRRRTILRFLAATVSWSPTVLQDVNRQHLLHRAMDSHNNLRVMVDSERNDDFRDDIHNDGASSGCTITRVTDRSAFFWENWFWWWCILNEKPFHNCCVCSLTLIVWFILIEIYSSVWYGVQ